MKAELPEEVVEVIISFIPSRLDLLKSFVESSPLVGSSDYHQQGSCEPYARVKLFGTPGPERVYQGYFSVMILPRSSSLSQKLCEENYVIEDRVVYFGGKYEWYYDPHDLLQHERCVMFFDCTSSIDMLAVFDIDEFYQTLLSESKCI
jgi:hypothetical protein